MNTIVEQVANAIAKAIKQGATDQFYHLDEGNYRVIFPVIFRRIGGRG